MEEFSTKYPAFRVTGNPIPEKLAAEILIRTSSNENGEDLLSGTNLEGKYNNLNLVVINNNLFSRYQSSWISIDGTFSGKYVRITDKWPTAEDIINELTIIAETFPQLETLFEFYEEPEEDGRILNPISKVAISNGTITVIPIEPRITIREAPSDRTNFEDVLAILQIEE